jgi:hypothetical protein
MRVFEIVVEPKIRRRGSKGALSGKKRAAALFRIWHGVRELIAEAERLGDSELVHFLSVAQLLVEEKAADLTSPAAAFESIDTSLPN